MKLQMEVYFFQDNDSVFPMILQMCNDLSKIEIVVADGGSTDDTCQRVKTAATTSKVPISLIHTAKGIVLHIIVLEVPVLLKELQSA